MAWTQTPFVQTPLWQSDPDARQMTRDQERLLALKGQLDGLKRLIQGEPHHLATIAEAFNVQEIVEGLLARPYTL